MRALIAFDLDGVLYSAEPFLEAAYREAIANVNRERPGSFPRVPSTQEILAHVGWPVTVILARLFPNAERAAIDLMNAETLRVICTHVLRGAGIVFPNVAETLARLQQSDYLLTVASNGRRPYIEAVLTANALATYFTDLIAVDQTRFKEKADLLRAYVIRHDAAPARLVMIGDRASDVEAAAAVGCHFIGCDYGHGHRDEIEAAGPTISSFDQLPEAIARVLA